MNNVSLAGRLTRDVDAKQSGETTVARFTLAVDRRYKRDGEPTADFINCVAFDKTGEFVEKYFRKGLRVGVTGRIQTGSYTNKDGQKVYTTDVIVDNCEFLESKREAESNGVAPAPTLTTQSQSNTSLPASNEGGWMDIPDGIDEQLPF